MVLKLKVLIQILQENSEKFNFYNGFQRGSFIWRPFFSSVLCLYLGILRLSRSSDFRIFLEVNKNSQRFSNLSLALSLIVLSWSGFLSPRSLFSVVTQFCAIAAKRIYLFEV